MDQANFFARPPACADCNDIRRITKRVAAREADVIPCPTCGNLNGDEYEKFRRDAWARDNKQPEIHLLDLTDDEMATFKRMQAENPNASKTTILSWIEGARYDPSKDEEFLKEAREGFRKWRDTRDKADAEYRGAHPYSTGDGRINAVQTASTAKGEQP